MLRFIQSFLSPTIERLEAKVEAQSRTIARLEGLCRHATNECAFQRTIIAALRDVNASLDARCNDLERGR